MAELNNHSERGHALLSASSAHRWLVCPPSAVAAEAYPKQETEYTQEGTLAHEVAEATVRAAIEKKKLAITVPEGLTTEMLNCADEYRDYILEQIGSDTAAVLLEQRLDFSPWVSEGFGTADCIIIQGKTMDVIDYKYGAGVKVPADDNPQMKLYGLGALNEFSFAYDIDKVRLHIFQPRMNNISVYELTADELMEWGEKTVKPIAEKAAKGKGTYKPGEHCRFCPHAGRCKALTKVCTEYVETHGIRVGVPTLAPFEVADVLAMEPLVSLWLKRVKDQALTTLLNGGGIPGYKAVAGRGTRAWTDELQVQSTLEAAGFTTEEITKTELLSVAQMEKSIGKKKAAEILTDLIISKQGAPTIAPVTDKRPVYDRLAEARKDFE